MKALLALSFALTSPALAAADRDVIDCEVYADEFAEVSTSVYGSSDTVLIANLKMRSDLNDKVVAAGAYFHVAGEYSRTVSEAGQPVRTESIARPSEELRVTGERTMDGRTLKVALPLNWNRYGQDVGERKVLDFTYYVTVKIGTEYTTYWLKDNGQNFSGEAISPSNYYYSESVFLGGYSSARYLWRDSGSPLFANRNVCVGR